MFSRHFDLVILDMTMPELSGEEVFREMRRIRPDVPVVLFNSLQWLLMLGVLLLVGSQGVRRLIDIAPKRLQRPLARALRVSPPEALGVTEK